MKNKLLSTLGICRKAGKLVWGFDTVAQSVKSGEAPLVLLASDLSPKSGKEMRFLCDKHTVSILPIPVTMEEIWFRVGKRAGILAVCDAGLSHTIRKTLSRMNEEEIDVYDGKIPRP